MISAREFSQIKALAGREAGRDVLRDYLVLALDQIETGPQDYAGAVELVSLLRPAAQIAHARLEALA